MARHDARDAQDTYAFGAFRLLRQGRQLCLGATPVRLGGRAIDLLVMLVERAGKVVSRAELERAIWPDSIVEDSCLRVHIGALRKALGDGVGEPRYIVNVPGRGYSFIAPVSVLSGLPPAPEAAGGATRPLPPRLTSILGRDEELRQLRARLAQRRLVTIVGHGGIGKTTLAVCLAAEVRAEYADGACFVDLAPLSGGAQIPDALAAALGIAVAGESVLLTIERWLAPRRLLLVFDNCEHLIDPTTAFIEQVLHIAPQVDVVATSREPLDAVGEWVHRLAPLACPPDDPALDVEQALAFPALRLLAERAGASMDTFQLGAAELPAAVKLCRRVDGVPLALEFAAARVGLLGMHGVIEQLDDRLRLLGSGRRTVLPRHRTLRALLDWSYELLTPAEQHVLRCCAVFSGAFSLDSAIAVAEDGPDSGADSDAEVARCVLALVSKSLLAADTRGPDASFALLGITRVYAIDKLADDPARDQVALRHARHTAALLGECELAWETLDQSCWLARASLLVGNVRGALDWAFGPGGDRELGARLAASSCILMSGVVREPELRRYAAQALEAIGAGASANPLDEVRLRSALSITELPADPARPGGAPDWTPFERAFDHAVSGGSAIEMAEALYDAFVRCYGAGQYAAAQEYAQRMRQVAEQAGHTRSLLVARRALAQCWHMLGQHESATVLAREVLGAPGGKSPLRMTSPIDRGVSMRILLARTAWLQGRGGEAAAIARDALDLAAKDRAPVSRACAVALGALPVALWRGDDAWAGELAAHLADLAERNALQYWGGWAQLYRQVLVARSSRANDLSCSTWEMDPKQGDHLATYWSALADHQARLRCERRLVAWCAPEVWRASAEQLLGAGTNQEGAAQALFLRALDEARRQGARAWELRCATSLARLWRESSDRARGAALLEPIVQALHAHHDGADLRAALTVLEAS